MDHKNFSEINLYKYLSILPSILYDAPDPKVVMHPQIITDPPPCFTVWWTCWGPTRPPSPIQHHDLPFDINLFIFVSSLKITHFQSSMVQFSYLWANLERMRTCLRLINGFLCCTCAPNLTSLKTRLKLMLDNNLHVSNRTCFVVVDAVLSPPSVIWINSSAQWD